MSRCVTLTLSSRDETSAAQLSHCTRSVQRVGAASTRDRRHWRQLVCPHCQCECECERESGSHSHSHSHSKSQTPKAQAVLACVRSPTRRAGSASARLGCGGAGRPLQLSSQVFTPRRQAARPQSRRDATRQTRASSRRGRALAVDAAAAASSGNPSSRLASALTSSSSPLSTRSPLVTPYNSCSLPCPFYYSSRSCSFNHMPNTI